MKISKGEIVKIVVLISIFIGVILFLNNQVQASDEVLLWIDTPTQNQTVKNTLTISGWNVSKRKDREVIFSINGVDITDKIANIARPDVLTIIQGYGDVSTNSLPGFRGNIDISDLADGKYSLEIKVQDSKTKKELTKKDIIFVVKKYETKINIDLPAQNQTVKDKLIIAGWNLSEQKNRSIKLSINGKDVTDEITQMARPDAVNAFKGQGYGDEKTNIIPGFRGNIDVSDLKDGDHKILIRIIDDITNEELGREEKNFKVKKYNTLINIDFPVEKSNNKDALFVQGWTLSEEKDRIVKIYINGQERVSDAFTFERGDAINAFKGQGYGDELTNPKAGFRDTLNISGYSPGDYTLTIRVISTKEQVILEEKSVVFGIKKIEFERGIYGYSGLKVAGDSRGQDLRYYKIGQGPNVLFATFTLHGFEDNFGRDGTELAVIAENFTNQLLSNNDYDLAQKWTIYVFPEVNPDGRNHGWTHNGPRKNNFI